MRISGKILIAILLSFHGLTYAGNTDTLWIPSHCHADVFPVLMVTPSQGFDSLSPVIVLLHGYGGDFASWERNSDKLPGLADQYGVVFVAPDAGNSWYFDTDDLGNPWCGETFPAVELIASLRHNYGLAKDPARTAICGLSMGGHGALRLAVRHPDLFGIVGSMGGVVDLHSSKIADDIQMEFGGSDSLFLDHASVIYEIEAFRPFTGNIYIDCAYGDHLYPANLQFHEALLEQGIAHTWINRPGGHDWGYWNESIGYFMVFCEGLYRIQNP